MSTFLEFLIVIAIGIIVIIAGAMINQATSSDSPTLESDKVTIAETHAMKFSNIILPDGTRCVVMEYKFNERAGLSCNFNKKGE